MKKTCFAAVMAILFFTAPRADAFLSQRLQWWKIHAQKIEETRDRLAREGAPDPQIMKLLDREYAGAREALGIFEQSLGSDASLVHVHREFSRNEIEERTRKLAIPLFSLTYLEKLISAPGERPILENCRVNLIQHLSSSRDASSTGTPLPSADLIGKISPEEWKIATADMVIAAFAEKHDQTRQTILTALGATLEEKYKAAAPMTPTALDALIVRETGAHLSRSIDSLALTGDHKTAGRSWHAQQLRRRLQGREARNKTLTALFPELKAPVVEHANEALMQEQEASLFQACTRTLIETVMARRPLSETAPDLKGLAPTEHQLRAILDEIDSIRRRARTVITGDEHREFIESLRTELMGVVKKELSPAAAYLDGHGKAPELRLRIEETMDLVMAYAMKSLAYIEWLRDSRRAQVDDVMQCYRSRLETYRSHRAFVASLASACSDLAALDDETLHARHHRLLSRSQNLFRLLDSSVSLDHDSMAIMTSRQIRECTALRHDFIQESRQSSASLTALLTDYTRRRGATALLLKNSDRSLKEKIAQYEIDHFAETALSYASAHGSLNYDETALESYRETFTRLRDEARDGAENPEIKESLARRSLIPACTDYDEERLMRQREARTFLKGRCQDALGRVATMMTFYRRQGIVIEAPPCDDEIARARSLISRKKTVAVASWKMDEGNYASIDANACRELARVYRVAAYGKIQELPHRRKPNRTVSLSRGEVSFYLPVSWVEYEPGQVDAFKGTIATYSNTLIESTIKVAALDSGDKNAQDLSGEWMKKTGAQHLRGKWINRDGQLFYWGVARRDNARIIETYAVKRDTRVFILSGETSRQRHSECTRILGALVDSLDF